MTKGTHQKTRNEIAYHIDHKKLGPATDDIEAQEGLERSNVVELAPHYITIPKVRTLHVLQKQQPAPFLEKG